MIQLGAPEGFKPHWIDGLSNEKYHADKEFISSTPLKDVINESPAFFFDKFYKAPPKPSTPPMQLSSLVHHAVLEGEDFIKRYVIQPKFDGHANSNVHKQAKAEWRKANEHKIIVTEEEIQTLEGTYESIHKHPDAILILRSCLFERSGYFVDDDTGIRLRIRYDAYDPASRILSDIKAVRSCKKEHFQFAIRDYRWDFSMAMYGQAITAIDGTQVDDQVFIAVEKERPYQCAVYPINEVTKQIGLSDYRKSLDIVSQCAKTGIWPSYQSTMEEIGLPEQFFKRYV